MNGCGEFGTNRLNVTSRPGLWGKSNRGLRGMVVAEFRATEVAAVAGFRLHVLILMLAILPGDCASAREPLVARKPFPRVDRFGDPLPQGAIARLGSIRFKHDTLSVKSVAFSPDSKLIASGGGDSTVRVWETNGGKPVAVLRGHEGGVTGVDFSADGKQIASCARKRLIVWEVGTWRKRIFTNRYYSDELRVRFTKDGKALILSDGSKLQRWRVKDGKLEAKVQSSNITGFDLHPDGKRIVAAGKGDRLRIYNVADLSHIASAGKNPYEADVAIFPDGKRAVVAGTIFQAPFELWNLETLKKRKLLETNVRNSPYSLTVAVSPDGRWIAGTRGHDAILILDAKTETVVRLIRNAPRVRDLKFSPDGKLLGSAGLRLRRKPAASATRIERFQQ